MNPKTSTNFPALKKYVLAAAVLLAANCSYAQPANDACSGAVAVTPGTMDTCDGPVASSTLTATMSATVPSCSAVPSSDVWFSFVAGNAYQKVALSNVTATNPDASTLFSFGVAVYSGDCSALTEAGCGVGVNSIFGNVPAEVTVGGLTAGNTYYVQVWPDEAYDSNFNPVANEINFDLCITTPPPPPPPPVNDLCSGALLLGQGVVVNGDNTYAIDDNLSAQPTCGGTAGNYKGVWYTATPTASGNLTIATCGSSFDTYLRVFSGGDCSAFANCVASDDDGCMSQSTVTFAATAGTTYYILLGGYNSLTFGTFTITATGVPLPVTKDELSGKVVAGNRAVLSWNTFTEQHNKGFEVQRSADGKTFTPAGFVASKGINGNSKERLTYSFTDPAAIDNAAFYRLQQTDIDGKKDYSNIIRLGIADAAAFNLVATPNPVKDRLHVSIFGKTGANAYFLVTDISGRMLQRIPVAAEGTDIDMAALIPGIYVLKYIDANRTQMLKISKQ